LALLKWGLAFRKASLELQKTPLDKTRAEALCMSASDAVDGSSTGIAMRHIRGVRMSPIGTKQTYESEVTESA
jgi:hypothetical protein